MQSGTGESETVWMWDRPRNESKVGPRKKETQSGTGETVEWMLDRQSKKESQTKKRRWWESV